ncbi:MAG TPA: hypothetical protein VFA22_02615, partial [Stellaceae bacterium]|nr:hypothetical protein [Stellaceae bacterium]
VDMLKDSLSDGGAVAEALRSHPVPLALIAAGAGWLLVEATSGRSSAELARELRGRLPLAGHSPEAAGSIAAADEPVASYAYARTKPVVGAIARTRERYRGAIAANPLALGMIGMLAGAALAMLLPRGAVEGRWLGTADTAAPTPVPPGGPSLSEPGSLSPG